MPTQKEKAELFQSLHVRGNPVILYNIWDAGSAKVVAAAGAKAIATGSWSVASANGFADGEQLPLELALGNLRRIAQTVDLPVTIDLESGYGDDAAGVGRTIAAAIEAGGIGCNLEDTEAATRTFREIAVQTKRIASARAAADAAGIPFFINARVDTFLRVPRESQTRAMLDSAMERCVAYAESGASGIFLPGLSDPALIAQAVNECPLPVNIMVTDSSSTSQLAAAGVARISHGPYPWISLMKQLEESARLAMQWS